MSQTPWRGGGVRKPVLQIVRGRVVYAPIIPDGGDIKPRPAIVLTIITPDEVGVVGVSTDAGNYLRSNVVRYPPTLWVPMPYLGYGGAHEEIFPEPCAAKLSWAQVMRVTDLDIKDKILAGADYEELVRKFNAYHAMPNP